MKRIAVPILGIAVLALAGCGDDRGERAVTGAGMGAAAGAIIGAITPMSVATGALIGAAAGGAIGGLTDKSTLNLGDAPWDRHASANTASAAPAVRGSSRVATIQSDLAALGYNPGPIDGKAGSQTHAAVRQYQQDHGLAVDGRLSAQLEQNLRAQRQTAGR
jgi:osmotically inducible lipoprotein OsmB